MPDETVATTTTWCPKCRCMESGVSMPFLTGEIIMVGTEAFTVVKDKIVCSTCWNEVQPVPDGERRPSRDLRVLGARYLSKTKRAFKGLFSGDTPKGTRVRVSLDGVRHMITTIPYLGDKLCRETMTYETTHVSASGAVYVQHFNRDGRPAGLRRVRDPKAATALAESILAKIQEAEVKAKAQEEANRTGRPVTITTSDGMQVTAEPEKGNNGNETVHGSGQLDAEGRGNAATDQQPESKAVDRGASNSSDSDRESSSTDAGTSLAA